MVSQGALPYPPFTTYSQWDACSGWVSSHLLGGELSRGTAQHISNAIIQALENNLHLTTYTKLVGFGSDGASVGCKSGGGTLLKKEQPLLFMLHCMAHWLELGFKGIIEANAFMATFTELLFSIYNFYFCYVLQLVDLLTVFACRL